VELKSVLRLHIEATTNFNRMPAPGTQYGVYLIFKIMNSWKGLDTELRASVTTNMDDPNPIELRKMKSVCLIEQQREGQGGLDEWREVKLGEFFCDYNTRNQQVKVTLMDLILNKKTGLIIAAIEFRPAV
jgi:Phloem protein 2